MTLKMWRCPGCHNWNDVVREDCWFCRAPRPEYDFDSVDHGGEG